MIKGQRLEITILFLGLILILLFVMPFIDKIGNTQCFEIAPGGFHPSKELVENIKSTCSTGLIGFLSNLYLVLLIFMFPLGGLILIVCLIIFILIEIGRKFRGGE